MLQKYKNLKNGPSFDRFERPPKITIFQKNFTHHIFWGIGTLLCPGSKVLKKWVFLDHPTVDTVDYYTLIRQAHNFINFCTI